MHRLKAEVPPPLSADYSTSEGTRTNGTICTFGTISGRSVGHVMGAGAAKSALNSVFQLKPSALTTATAMQYGLESEEKAAAIVCEQLGDNRLAPGRYLQHSQHPYLTVSPDFVSEVDGTIYEMKALVPKTSADGATTYKDLPEQMQAKHRHCYIREFEYKQTESRTAAE